MATIVTSSRGVVLGCSGDLASKLLEGLALGLGDEEGGEDTAEHEESKDLEDVVQPRRSVSGGGATDTERTDESLGDDGTDLAGSGGDTVGSRSVASREALSGDDEGGGVGAEVEEELGEDVDGKLGVGADVVVCEAEDDEEDGENDETHELDRLATNGVNSGDSDPVAGHGTSKNDDDVADGSLVEHLVDVATTAEADGREDDGVVERETVVSDIEEEPGASRSEKHLSVLPLRVVAVEVTPGSLRGHEVLAGNETLGVGDLIRVAGVLAVNVSLGVGTGLDNIALDVEGVAGSLGDGETVVKGNASGDSAETDDDAPHLVHSKTTDTIAVLDGLGGLERLFEARDDDEGDDTGGELTETLHGEDGSHHGTSPLGGGKLGSDDRGKRVVTTNTDTHEDTPENDDTDNGDSRRGRGKRLSESCEDDQDELETVHPLTTDTIGEVTETELSDDSTGGGRDLDSSVGRGRDLAGVGLSVVPVDDSQHGGDKRDGEDVVGIGEETGTSHDNGTNVVPAERSLVDLGKS